MLDEHSLALSQAATRLQPPPPRPPPRGHPPTLTSAARTPPYGMAAFRVQQGVSKRSWGAGLFRPRPAKIMRG